MRKRVRPRFCGFIALFAAAALIFDAERLIRPNVAVIAEHRCATAAAEIINSAVLDELSSAEGLIESAVKIDRSADGKIISVVSNGYLFSIIKERIAKRLVAEFSDAGAVRTKAHFGALFGIPTVSAGPEIPIYIYFTGAPEAEISGTLVTTGINQSIYRVTLCYRAEISTLVAFHPASATVENEIILSEIVFSGEVPQVVVNR